MVSPENLVECQALDAFIDTLESGGAAQAGGLSTDLTVLVRRLASMPAGAWDVAVDQVPLVDSYLDQLGRAGHPIGLDPAVVRTIERMAALPVSAWAMLPTTAELLAIDAYVDALGTGTAPPVGATAGLLALVDRLAAMPVSVWSALPTRAELLALDAFIDVFALHDGPVASIDRSTVELVRALVALPAAIWDSLPTQHDVLALDGYIDAIGLAHTELAASLPAGLALLVDNLAAMPVRYWGQAPSTLELAALDVLMDSLSLAEAPADRHLDRTLTRLVQALAALPVSAWDNELSLVAAADVDRIQVGSSESTGGLRLVPGHSQKRNRRGASRRGVSRLEVVVGIAAAVAVLAVSAGVSGFGSRPAPQPSPTPVAAPAKAAWQLTSFIDQPAWQVSSSASGLTSTSIALSCGSASDCVAEAQGTSVVESTTDGGVDWSTSSLSDGAVFTADADCVSASVCFGAGLTAIPTGSDSGGPTLFFKTTNGGATWSSSPLSDAIQQVSSLSCFNATDCVAAGLVPPTSPNAASVSEGEFTEDGGNTWTASEFPEDFASSYESGLSCDDSGDCALVGANTSTGNGAAITTSDSGRTWQAALVPGGVGHLERISCADTQVCLATAIDSPQSDGDPAGSASVVLDSTDGGVTWTRDGDSGLSAVSALSLSCASGVVCTIAGASVNGPGESAPSSSSGVIAQTSNGGQTWSSVALPTQSSTSAPLLGARTNSDASSAPVNVASVSSLSCNNAGRCIALAPEATSAQSSPEEVVFTSQPAN